MELSQIQIPTNQKMSEEFNDDDLGLNLVGPSNSSLHQTSHKNITDASMKQASKEVSRERKLERQMMSMRKISRSDATGQKIIQSRLEYDKLKQKVEESMNLVDKKNVAIERIEKEHSEKVQSLKAQIEQLKNAIESHKETTILQISKVEADNDVKLQEIGHEKEEEEVELKNIESSIQKLMASLESTQEEKEDPEKRKQQFIQDLEESEKKFQTKIRTIHGKNNTLNDSIAQNTDLLISLKSKREELKSNDGTTGNFDELNEKKKLIHEKIANLEKLVSDLKIDVSNNEGHLAELSKQILTLKTTQNSAQDELNTYSTQISKLNVVIPQEKTKPIVKEPVKEVPKVVVPSGPIYLRKLEANDVSLTTLNLSSKNVTDSDVSMIVKALHKNTHLKVLDLSKNAGIKGVSMDDVVAMIKVNDHIEELNFEDCPVSRTALDLLLKNLSSNTSLTQLFGGSNEQDADIDFIDELMDRNVEMANK